MNTIAKKALAFFLAHQRAPTPEELGAQAHPLAASKHLAFVTFYKNGAVVASSGRVEPKKPNTVAECADNAALCAQDPRFAAAGLSKPGDADALRCRVDVIDKANRRMVKSAAEVDALREGMLVISQAEGKLGLVLPGVAPAVTSSQELYEVALRKAGLPASTPQESVVIYALASQVFSDF